jgi:hypothetical protein
VVVMPYLFYLDAYYNSSLHKDFYTIWQSIEEKIIELFGEPEESIMLVGEVSTRRWWPTMLKISLHGAPKGVYIANEDDAIIFVMVFDKAIRRIKE